MKFTLVSNTFRSATLASQTLVGDDVTSPPPPVTYQLVRLGETTEVTVTTTISDVVWYCWYLDGAYVGKTSVPTRSFHVPAGEQLRLEVIPTADTYFDPIANAPDGYPASRTLWWIRSLASDVAQYRVDQREAAGDWTTLAVMPDEADRWEFFLTTGRLQDLTEYTWRIVALDAAGNESTATVIGPERIVRTPDAPNFTAEYDPETELVAFAVVPADDSEDIFSDL